MYKTFCDLQYLLWPSDGLHRFTVTVLWKSLVFGNTWSQSVGICWDYLVFFNCDVLLCLITFLLDRWDWMWYQILNYNKKPLDLDKILYHWAHFSFLLTFFLCISFQVRLDVGIRYWRSTRSPWMVWPWPRHKRYSGRQNKILKLG